MLEALIHLYYNWKCVADMKYIPLMVVSFLMRLMLPRIIVL